MVGSLSAAASAGSARPFDPIVARPSHRLSIVIATSAETADLLRADGQLPETYLRLGRLAAFYRDADSQLPRVLAVRDLDPPTLAFRRGGGTAATIRAARLWLFDVQAGPIVAVLSVDLDCEPLVLIPFLEDLYYDDLTIGGSPIDGVAADLLDGVDAAVRHSAGSRLELTSQRHQMVFTSATLPEDSVQRLIYRADLDANPQYSSIQYPAELNRRPTSGAAVGAYVSVLAAQQDYIENCALLSSVQVVAASCKIRRVRFAAYETLLRVRELGTTRATMSRPERRAELARLHETLAEQELALTFGVEAACEIGILVPALRVENFHRQLVACTGLRDSIETVSTMLARATSVLAAEEGSQTALDAQRQDLRRLRYGVTIGLLSTIAVPIGIILGFFGGNYTQVDGNRSMFDWSHYHDMYLAVLGLILAAGTVFAILFLLERLQIRRASKPSH
ncbi:hypothetical protein FraEuI1c_1499 [Pseudofrankia inefficax]|uniref:Uncharacterized protein n=1 Tax=Pseudofrankia inefficax (strain DSM 45817 / CECT 9037 / DDB 130130 / EuI1c) TaxID=298654 RepID=E3J6D4_PSEI1|nr:hypothetical protein FraEuI1c_1499 [Pseudofrankia inefficax]